MHHYVWGLFVCIIVCLCLVFKGKIRQRGTKKEAAVVIEKWGAVGTRQESSNICLIGALGPFPRGVIICEDVLLVYAGRRCPAGGVVEQIEKP